MDRIKLNPFQVVAPGKKAVLSTDQLRGYSVHGLLIKMTGTTISAALLDNFRVRLGGKEIVNPVSGTRIGSMNSYAGTLDSSGYLAYFFGDPTARTIRGEHLGDLDLSVYNDLLEISLDVGSGASSDVALECSALVGVPKKQMDISFTDADAATFKALVYTQVTLQAAATRQAIQVAGGGNGSRFAKINFFHTGHMTSLEYKKQSLLKWEEVTVADNAAIQTYYGRTPQSNLYVLDRTMDGNLGEAETTVDKQGAAWNQQFLVTSDAADTLDCYVDALTVWGIL